MVPGKKKKSRRDRNDKEVKFDLYDSEEIERFINK
jgi:hypothetical protein